MTGWILCLFTFFFPPFLLMELQLKEWDMCHAVNLSILGKIEEKGKSKQTTHLDLWNGEWENDGTKRCGQGNTFSLIQQAGR